MEAEVVGMVVPILSGLRRRLLNILAPTPPGDSGPSLHEAIRQLAAANAHVSRLTQEVRRNQAAARRRNRILRGIRRRELAEYAALRREHDALSVEAQGMRSKTQRVTRYNMQLRYALERIAEGTVPDGDIAAFAREHLPQFDEARYLRLAEERWAARMRAGESHPAPSGWRIEPPRATFD